jgi:hypothetical protein
MFDGRPAAGGLILGETGSYGTVPVPGTGRLVATGIAGDYWDKNGELAGRKTRGVSAVLEGLVGICS